MAAATPWTHRTWLVLSVVVLAICGAVAVLWRLIPWTGDKIAQMIPVAAEEALGQPIWLALAPEHKRCGSSELTRELNAIIARLTENQRGKRYRFQVAVVKDDDVNALAAPGGYIVIYRGLLEQMETPEEMAAVLAHEIQHVVQRHSTKSILRAFAIQIGIAMLIGGSDVFTDTTTLLTTLSFMRSDESGADRAAMRMLSEAGISPMEMVRAFRRLERFGPDAEPTGLTYLSTHPPISERIEAARRAAAETRVRPRAMERSGSWHKLRKSCVGEIR